MKYFQTILLGLLALSTLSCSTKKENTIMKSTISKEEFGSTPEGQIADLYTLTNGNGMVVNITNYGGIITKLTAPDRQGQWADVVLGFDSLQPYLNGHPFFGALVGRYGNRIAKGKFQIDGQNYQLPINNGPNSLHGGIKGFDKVIWATEQIENDSIVGLRMTYTSQDGEEGFPGTLQVQVDYRLDNHNMLTIDYTATTDKPTIVNLTNHSYFNLTGLQDNILGHEVSIKADSIVPVNATLIPTGKLMAVAGTPFDLRNPIAISKGIDNIENEQIKFGGGYDHCWVIDRSNDELIKIASVSEPKSGRYMEVFSTEPGVQLYTGNFLDGSLKGKGTSFDKRFALCLETQHFPDSPNHPEFPSTELRPGETYRSTTQYKFSTK